MFKIKVPKALYKSKNLVHLRDIASGSTCTMKLNESLNMAPKSRSSRTCKYH